MKNKTTQFVMWSAVFATVLSGCVKADYTSVSDHPLQSKVTVKTDWSAGGSNVPLPDGVNILQDGKHVAPNADGTLPLVDPDDYRLVLYNDAPPMVITSQEPVAPATKGDVIATLPRDAEGFVTETPDWFFSGYKDITLERDKEYAETLSMQQQIRELNFELTITEGDPSRIIGIIAELSGVAGGWNLITNEPYGDAAKVKLSFTLTGNKLSVKIRLLGIQNEPQVLTIRFAFADGRTQEIVSDITSQLVQFNNYKAQPMTLKGEVHSPIATEQTGTINNWTIITDDINVN